MKATSERIFEILGPAEWHPFAVPQAIKEEHQDFREASEDICGDCGSPAMCEDCCSRFGIEQ